MRLGQLNVPLYTRELAGHLPMANYLLQLSRKVITNYRQIENAVNRNDEQTGTKMREWFFGADLQ